MGSSTPAFNRRSVAMSPIVFFTLFACVLPLPQFLNCAGSQCNQDIFAKKKREAQFEDVFEFRSCSSLYAYCGASQFGKKKREARTYEIRDCGDEYNKCVQNRLE